LGISRTKRQKRESVRAMLRRVVALVVMGGLIVGAMYLYDYATTAESFAITSVELRGLTRIEPGDIEAMLEDLKGQNIILAPLNNCEARIEAHPRVKLVSVRRVLPDRIVCEVEEREPVALIFTDRFMEVDQSAMIMAEDDYAALLDLPIITGLESEEVRPGRISKSRDLALALHALELCRTLGDGLVEDISELSVSRNGITIKSLSNDCSIVLGHEDYEKRLKKYFFLRDTIKDRDREPRLIDLRFNDQIVVRGHI